MTKRERDEEAFDQYVKRGARELADLMIGADEHIEKQDREIARLRSQLAKALTKAIAGPKGKPTKKPTVKLGPWESSGELIAIARVAMNAIGRRIEEFEERQEKKHTSATTTKSVAP